MKALVIGASGAFGGAVAREMIERGIHVTAMVRPGGSAVALDVATVQGDALVAEDVLRAARGQDVIVFGFHVPYTQWDPVAVDAARNVAAAARAVGATVLFPGNVYTLPTSDAPLDERTEPAPRTKLGRIRVEMEAIFERARLILTDMGANIFHAGPAGAGQVAKGCNNMLLAIHMIGTCEALEMGVRNGLDPAVLSQIMLASSGRNWSLEVYNPYPGVMEKAPASNDYKPGFMVDLMVKDLGLALDIARHSGCDNPMGHLAQTLYSEHQAAGNGQLDFSSILRRLQRTEDRG